LKLSKWRTKIEPLLLTAVLQKSGFSG
jgi:hypothetical protein